ncbi:MAG: hypothetical protein Q4E32_04635 [Bacteroidales bacterium]|nr:hypothetical protein [Bacteroidales bacterium]
MKKSYQAPCAVQEKLDGGELCLVIDGGGAASAGVEVEAPIRDQDPNFDIEMVEEEPKSGWDGGLW